MTSQPRVNLAMDIRKILTDYHRTGMKYQEINDLLRTVHSIEISTRQMKRLFKQYGLRRKKNFSELDSLVQFIISELRSSGQMHGYRWLHSKCLLNGFTVTREMIRRILQVLDGDGVEIRRKKRLRRRLYSCKGPNYLWHADGNDKLKPYGIAIHGCIDGFSRKIIWLKAHITNNDPYVVAGYFAQSVKVLGACPQRMRTDYGTENGNMEVILTALRRYAPSCFLYGTSQLNQRIESWWGILRKECLQFWMNCFSELKDNGQFGGLWFDKDLIRFCFMKLIRVRMKYCNRFFGVDFVCLFFPGI